MNQQNVSGGCGSLCSRISRAAVRIVAAPAAVVAAQAALRIGRADELALDLRLRADADRHGVHVGREHPPRRFHRARQLEDQVARVAGDQRVLVGVVGDDARRPAPRRRAAFADVLGDGRFLAALAGNGHQLQDELLGAGQVGSGLGGSELGLRRFAVGHGAVGHLGGSRVGCMIQECGTCSNRRPGNR